MQTLTQHPHRGKPLFLTGHRNGADVTINVARIIEVAEDRTGYRVSYDTGAATDGYSSATIWAERAELQRAGILATNI